MIDHRNPAHGLTVEDYRQRMTEAWQEVEKRTKPTHHVRNCLSDVQDLDQAKRRWQYARQQYLEACKMDGVSP